MKKSFRMIAAAGFALALGSFVIGTSATGISGFGRVSPIAAKRDPKPAIGMMTDNIVYAAASSLRV